MAIASLIFRQLLLLMIIGTAQGQSATESDDSECVPSGGTIADGDCNFAIGGCCDMASECNDDGTCSLPPFGCTDDTCEFDESCVAGTMCIPLDAQVTTAGFNDSDSPYLGVLSYDGDDVYLIGESDPSGENMNVTEAITYSDEVEANVHIFFDESGKPSSAYIEGYDEVFYFQYDNDGNLVGATENMEDVSINNRRLSPSMVTDIYGSPHRLLQEQELRVKCHTRTFIKFRFKCSLMPRPPFINFAISLDICKTVAYMEKADENARDECDDDCDCEGSYKQEDCDCNN